MNQQLLLVVLDTVLAAGQYGAFSEWSDRVASEGNFRIEVVGMPRVGIEDVNRHNAVQAIRAEIARAKPDVVVLVGGVAVPITGWHNPDGHGARALATDVPYMVDTSYQFKDTQNWGTNRVSPNPQYSTWNNLPGDGKWDEIDVPVSLYRRPVTRIFDFTQLPYGYVGTITTGCHAGEPRLPAVNEAVAVRDYLDRNMAYRTGKWAPPKIGILHGQENPFWPSSIRSWTFSKTPGLAWSWSTTADLSSIPRSLWWFGNTQNNEDWWRLDDANCNRIQAVWWQTYKSFGMEWFMSGAGAKRWQRNGLMASWGRGKWFVPTGAVTMADAMTSSIKSATRLHMLDFVMGDATLPIDPKPDLAGPPAPMNLKVVR